MALFEPISPLGASLTFSGSSDARDTVAFWNYSDRYQVSVDLHVDVGAIGSESFSTYDNQDRAISIKGRTIWTKTREDNGQSIDNVIGGAGGDYIVGNDRANLLVGLDAPEARVGSGSLLNGMDLSIFSGLASKATGHNHLRGEGGSDILIGDMRIGDGALDVLNGGNGSDILDGGIGKGDELWGGAHSDVFVFNQSSGKYFVMDFQNGWDAILIQGEGNLDFSGLNISQKEAHAHVTFGDTEIILRNTDQAVLNVDDFVFL